MSEFEEVLGNGNGHTNGNGKNGNGHVLIGSTGASSGSPDETTPTIESSTLPVDEAGGGISMSNPTPFTDEGPTLFMGG
jgi:hypothetical protein